MAFHNKVPFNQTWVFVAEFISVNSTSGKDLVMNNDYMDVQRYFHPLPENCLVRELGKFITHCKQVILAKGGLHVTCCKAIWLFNLICSFRGLVKLLLLHAKY